MSGRAAITWHHALVEYRLSGLLLLSFCVGIVWVCVRPFTGPGGRSPTTADLAAIPVVAALVVCSAVVGFRMSASRRSETIVVAQITSAPRHGQIIDAAGRRFSASPGLRAQLAVGARYRCEIIPLPLVPLLTDIAVSCQPAASVALAPSF
jgi:hypothetical protein